VSAILCLRPPKICLTMPARRSPDSLDLSRADSRTSIHKSNGLGLGRRADLRHRPITPLDAAWPAREPQSFR
jgi:hypothetical protein